MFELLVAGAAGYVACIIFPMPIISRFVLDKWAALGRAVKG